MFKVAVPKSACILCVDDGEAGLLLRRLVLEQNGFTVLSATTPQLALGLFQANDVALVISDHLLSGGVGTDLARELKKLKPSVPVLLLAGTAPESMENVDCFILKTESTQTVLSAIRDLIARSSRSSLPIQ